MDTPDVQGDELEVEWFKVESVMAVHRKTRLIPRDDCTISTRTAAMGVWFFAASWTAREETDGFVPAEEFERWDPTGELTNFLAHVGYLDHATVGGEVGYYLHDWLDVQQSKAQMDARRTYDAARQRKSRSNRTGQNRPDPDDRGPGNGRSEAIQTGLPIGVRNGVTADVTPHVTRDVTEVSDATHGEVTCESTVQDIDIEREVTTKTRVTAAPPHPRPDDEPPGFVEFWNAWHRRRRVDKRAARRAYTAALRRGVSPLVIVEAAKRYTELMERSRTEPRFIKHPSTWLNAGSYEDETPPPRQVSSLYDT